MSSLTVEVLQLVEILSVPDPHATARRAKCGFHFDESHNTAVLALSQFDTFLFQNVVKPGHSPREKNSVEGG